MYFFGHLGIGSKIVSPWTKKLPQMPLYLGTLLPDIIDKPLYYSYSLMTGRHGQELFLITGTRTFGHTLLFLLVILAFARIKKSLALKALAWGIVTHLLLDWSVELFELRLTLSLPLFWPYPNGKFPHYPFHDAKEHFLNILRPSILIPEIIGFGLFMSSIKNRLTHRVTS